MQLIQLLCVFLNSAV